MSEASLNVALTATTFDYSKAMKQAQTDTEAFIRKAKEVGTATSSFGNAFSSFGRTAKEAQNNIRVVGLQVGDFVTQISSGQPVVRSLVQQMGQVAGVFGPAGIAIGIVATALLPLAANMFSAQKAVVPLKDALSQLKGSVGDYQTSLKSIQESMNDPAWATTAFGKMITDVNRALASLELAKIKNQFSDMGSSIAADFTKAMTATQQWDYTLGGLNSMIGGINPNILRMVDGLKKTKTGFEAINSMGVNFAQITGALRSMGIEANTAGTMAANLLNALKSGDMPSIAIAAKAVADAIMEQGNAAGGATPKQIELANAMYLLSQQAGGVQQNMNAAAGAIGNLARTAASAIPQIMALANALATLNINGAIGGFKQLYATFTDSGTVGAANQLLSDFNKNLQANAKAYQAQREAVLDSIDPTRALNREKARLNELAKLGIISETELAAAIDKVTAAAGGGGGGRGGGGGGGKGGGGAAGGLKKVGDAAKGMVDKVKEATDAAKQFNDALASLVQSAGTQLVDAMFAIAEGSKSAKEAFADMAKSMLKQIAQLVLQLLVLKPLMSMFGGGFGLFGGASPMSLSTRSIGPSLLSTPRNTIGNYQGYSPSPSVMQTFRSSTVSNAQPVVKTPEMNVTINNHVEGASVKTRRGNNGQLEVDFILDVVSDAFTRGGNKIDSAAQRAFGVRRQGY